MQRFDNLLFFQPMVFNVVNLMLQAFEVLKHNLSEKPALDELLNCLINVSI